MVHWSERGPLCAPRPRRWANSTWRWKRRWWERTTRSWKTGRGTPTTNRWSVASKKQKRLTTASAKHRNPGPRNSKRWAFDYKHVSRSFLISQFHPSVLMITFYWLATAVVAASLRDDLLTKQQHSSHSLRVHAKLVLQCASQLSFPWRLLSKEGKETEGAGELVQNQVIAFPTTAFILAACLFGTFLAVSVHVTA